MRRIAAVGPCDDVAPEAGGAAWTAVTACTAVDQAGAERQVGRDVAEPIAAARAEALRHGELALEQLPPAANRARRVAIDDVERRVRRAQVADSGADLLSQRLRDARVLQIRRLSVVVQLRLRGRRREQCERADGAQGRSRTPCTRLWCNSHRFPPVAIRLSSRTRSPRIAASGSRVPI